MTLFPFQNKLIEDINNDINSVSIVALTGEAGSGKRNLIENFLLGRKESIVKIGFYSENRNESGVINFRKALRDIQSQNEFTKYEEFINKASKDIPHIGNTVSYILDQVINRKINKLSERSFTKLNIEEKEIINRIANISHRNSIIIVLENFQWRNNSANKIISIIGENREDKKMFKNEIKILATFSEPYDFEGTIFDNKNKVKIINVRNLNADEITSVIKKGINTTEHRLISVLTGGNIELVLQLSKFIKKEDTINIESSIDNIRVLERENQIELVSSVFSKMLEKIFGKSTETITVLEIASVIGDVFNKLELAALTEKELNYVEFQLKIASEGKVVINRTNVAQFIHPLIRQLFSRRLKSKRFEYHTKFAQCLKKIRPSEFLLRGYHYYESGDSYNAVIFYLLANYSNILAGNNLSDSILSVIDKLTDSFRLRKFHEHMLSAHDLYIQNEVLKANEVLDNIDGTDAHNVLLYSYFAYFQAKVKLYYLFSTKEIYKIAQDLATARNKLLQLDEIYFALKIDILLIHIYGYKLSDIEMARDIEREFISLYSNLPFADNNFLDLSHEYKRKSAIICSPEIAEKRLLDCLRYYENEESNILEYYKSLNNCTAIQIYLGKYKEAEVNISKCLKLVRDYSFIDFPELYKIMNNYALVTLLHPKNEGDFKERANETIKILSSLGSSSLSRVVQINLAILNSICGKIDEGINILKSVLDDIEKKSYQNAFYIYHANLNISVMYFLRGMNNLAKEHLNVAMEISELANGTDYRFYNQRDNMLLQLINDNESILPNDYLGYFLKKKNKHLGPSWHFIGLGYAFSELHFWST